MPQQIFSLNDLTAREMAPLAGSAERQMQAAGSLLQNKSALDMKQADMEFERVAWAADHLYGVWSKTKDPQLKAQIQDSIIKAPRLHSYLLGKFQGVDPFQKVDLTPEEEESRALDSRLRIARDPRSQELNTLASLMDLQTRADTSKARADVAGVETIDKLNLEAGLMANPDVQAAQQQLDELQRERDRRNAIKRQQMENEVEAATAEEQGARNVRNRMLQPVRDRDGSGYITQAQYLEKYGELPEVYTPGDEQEETRRLNAFTDRESTISELNAAFSNPNYQRTLELVRTGSGGMQTLLAAREFINLPAQRAIKAYNKHALLTGEMTQDSLGKMSQYFSQWETNAKVKERGADGKDQLVPARSSQQGRKFYEYLRQRWNDPTIRDPNFLRIAFLPPEGGVDTALQSLGGVK